MRIAIVGSGISGLTCAYELAHQHDITLFEANDYLGGHTHTHALETSLGQVMVDSGFIVFNKKTYPQFVELLEQWGVSYRPTSMSFSVHCEQSGLEYNGTDLNRLFIQRRNLLRPRFWSMVAGILDFNRRAKDFLGEESQEISLQDFLKRYRIKDQVVRFYLIPMMAAVWSTDPLDVWRFPARFVLRFFENHGFLEIDERPQWYVIEGGSRSYIEKMLPRFQERVRLACPVTKIRREAGEVLVESSGGIQSFDAIVLATHSDTALSLLEQPSPLEEKILRALPYVHNEAFLHSDRSFLPRRPKAWAAWNYVLPAEEKRGATVTYQMNLLQGLETAELFNVTLNPHRPIEPSTVLKRLQYAHPLFTEAGVRAQKQWAQISGQQRTYYCGAYWGNGFHEDGVVSAQRVIQQIGER